MERMEGRWARSYRNSFASGWDRMLMSVMSEWEARPSSPSSIRIIYYGKLLEDKARLYGKVS